MTNEELLTRLLKVQLETSDILQTISAMAKDDNYESLFLNRAYAALDSANQSTLKTSQALGMWIKCTGGIQPSITSN